MLTANKSHRVPSRGAAAATSCVKRKRNIDEM